MNIDVAIINANILPIHDEYINPKYFVESISFNSIINKGDTLEGFELDTRRYHS